MDDFLSLIGGWILVACIVALSMAVSVGAHAGGDSDLVIFHAGSLSVPFRDVTAAFNQKHPDVKAKAEASGSRDATRKISDLGRSCDVFGSADYEVVDQLLAPKYAAYNILFATNELAIAYTEKSKYADEFNSKNWYEILLKKDVRFGRSDPDRDPCGYRTLMMFQLAEKQYKIAGLGAKLTAKHGDKLIRPKETDLLALLESGEIDYLIIYRSVCKQHGLKTLRLPATINLGSEKYADFYKQAKVKVIGKAPGKYLTMIGAPILYSVTIPKNAENPKLAEAWVALLLSPQGRRIMEQDGQGSIFPARADHFDRLPASLKPFCK